MKKSVLRNCASVTAVAAVGLFAVPAFAQDAAAPASNETQADTLDTIVVTASAGDKSKLNTSASISSVSNLDIQHFNATSTAEVYRLIPGIQVAGTQGDGGNSNIGVRGLRTPTGGSPFVQVQEDGLPTVLFGDIQFGNNDYWTHFDATVANVEAVRGGSASTFASQAPGAVINYISQTGKKEGGYLQLSKGANYDNTKVDFRYGGHISDGLYFHLGGYYNVGHGPLHAGYNVSNSYQIKGNITITTRSTTLNRSCGKSSDIPYDKASVVSTSKNAARLKRAASDIANDLSVAADLLVVAAVVADTVVAASVFSVGIGLSGLANTQPVHAPVQRLTAQSQL